MKSFWICISLSVVFSISICYSNNINCRPYQALTVDTVISIVKTNNDLFIQYYTLYKDSSIVYDRLIQDNISLNEKVNYQIAKAAYFKQKQWYTDAGDAYAKIYLDELNDSAKYNILYQSALCYYLSENFPEALSQFLYMSNYVSDSALIAKSIPLYALVLNETIQWEEAHNMLDNYLCAFPEMQKNGTANRVDSIYSNKTQPKLKDPGKAETLNTFLPGLGYIYAGYIGEGIVNTGAQLFFLGLTGVGIYYKYYISAALGGFQIFSRFYKGGLSRTPFLVEKRNYLLKKKYNQKLKILILQL